MGWYVELFRRTTGSGLPAGDARPQLPGDGFTTVRAARTSEPCSNPLGLPTPTPARRPGLRGWWFDTLTVGQRYLVGFAVLTIWVIAEALGAPEGRRLDTLGAGATIIGILAVLFGAAYAQAYWTARRARARRPSTPRGRRWQKRRERAGVAYDVFRGLWAVFAIGAVLWQASPTVQLVAAVALATLVVLVIVLRPITRRRQVRDIAQHVEARDRERPRSVVRSIAPPTAPDLRRSTGPPTIV